MNISQLFAPFSLEIHTLGPPLSEGPLPTLIYFALSGIESLSLEPINTPIKYASKLPIRCISFTLPYHGDGYPHSEAMSSWSESLVGGIFWLKSYVSWVVSAIEYFIDNNVIDKDHIAVAGLSRGGFLALHLASCTPLISHVLAYAPLISLSALNEFTDRHERQILEPFDCNHLIPQLTEKHFYFSIGNRDLRVGTKLCCTFVEELVEALFKAGKRSPPADFYIHPSIGRHGHGTSDIAFQRGIKWLQKEWNLDQ